MELFVVAFLCAVGMIELGVLVVYIISEILDAREKERQKRQDSIDAMNRRLEKIIHDMEEIQRNLRR